MTKIAVLTCDIEPDFGGRVGTTELVTEYYIGQLLLECHSMNVPLSSFVVTNLLKSHKAISLLDDVHAHSHTHDIAWYRETSHEEIERSQWAFKEHYGRSSLGYRAPQGVINPQDMAVLNKTGFKFDSSMCHARRRGVFDYRELPNEPFNFGMWEFPMAAINKKRFTLSTLKLYGKMYWKYQMKKGLPETFIINTHLHDLFPVSAFHKLPPLMRIAYHRNKYKGFELLRWLIKYLKDEGYEFMTMTSLYELQQVGQQEYQRKREHSSRQQEQPSHQKRSDQGYQLSENQRWRPQPMRSLEEICEAEKKA